MLTFIYHLDTDEHVRAIRLWMSHRRVPTWLRAAPWVLGGLALALAAWAAASPAEARGDLLWDWAPLLVVLWLSVAIFRRMLSGRVWRGLYDELPNVDQPVTITVSDEGVAIRSKTERADETWEEIRQVVETPEFFLFIVSDDCAHYLPRHAVLSQADLDTLRETIRRALDERAELLDTPLERTAVAERA